MTSLFTRLFRRTPRALPSYTTTTSSSLISKISRTALLCGSLYCTSQLIRHYLIDFSFSEGDSMLPTIPSSTTVSIASPLHRHGKNIRVGDIVHAKNPLLPNSRIGKRVVGLPGDYVLRDESFAPTPGKAELQPIYTPYTTGGLKGEREEPRMIQVPEGHVWLAGDNLSRSRDSRFYGAVPLALVESKLLFNGDGVWDWTSYRGEQLRAADPNYVNADVKKPEVKATGKSVG